LTGLCYNPTMADAQTPSCLSCDPTNKLGVGGYIAAGLLSAGVGAVTYVRVRHRDHLNSTQQARYEAYMYSMFAGGIVLLIGATFLRAWAI
jgi:hypothetical protein